MIGRGEVEFFTDLPVETRLNIGDDSAFEQVTSQARESSAWLAMEAQLAGVVDDFVASDDSAIHDFGLLVPHAIQ